jgi:hypothetical protein
LLIARDNRQPSAHRLDLAADGFDVSPTLFTSMTS